MRIITQFVIILLLSISGTSIKAQQLKVQNGKISDAFNIGFLAMAPKIMCADTIETIFITLTNMTRPIEVMVQILDGPDNVLVETPVRLVGTPCACLEVRIPPITDGRRVVALQLLARRTDIQCDDFEVTLHRKIFIDSCISETFIETDKPVYIAGEKVKFRVLTLKADLRPDTTTVCKIWIADPEKTPMIKWTEIPGNDGLIEKEFPLSKEPRLGKWTIKLHYHGRHHVLHFQVEKYDIPRFSLLIKKPAFITVDSHTMKLKVCARSPLGQAVPGSIRVKLAIINDAKAVSKKKRPVLTFEKEDTGLSGCYDVAVDLDHLELCSEKYTLVNAHLRLSVTYTDATTGFTVKETDRETLIVREPYKITFDASPVYKPGLPYHGRVVVRNPDGSPAVGKSITLTALGDEYGISEETLLSDEDGIIHFLLPEIIFEIKTLSLRARSTYETRTPCQKPDSFPIAPPEASFTVQQQYSPTGSFIQITPITDRVKINSLQTITIHFVSQKPEFQGINFHLMFMSRGKILRSTEVFIWPEDYDAYKHPGAFLPIPASQHESHTEKELAEPHIGPIDTPVSLVKPGKPKVTHRKFKITAAMSPLTSVIVYYIRKDNEVVSDMIDFKVQEVFENEVKMNFVKKEQTPRALTKLKIQAAPGSLCAYGVIDTSVYMMGEQNRITKKRVFNALARLQLSAEGGYPDQSHKCANIYQLPILEDKQGRKDLTGVLPNSIMEIPGFAPELLDGAITFMNMGLVYLTNLGVETSPCPKYTLGDQFKPPIFSANKDITPAEDTLVDVPGKTLRIKSFFPKTWLWEIKRTSDETGEASVNVVVPDRITTYIGRGFCTNPVYGAGVSDIFPLKVFQAFYLMMELPPPVIRGEKVPVTVTVYDYLQDCMVIKLTLKKSGDYTASEIEPERTVCACSGMPATAVFYIVPNVLAQLPVEVYAIAVEDNIEDSVCGDDPVDMIQVGLTDSIKKRLVVEARGIIKTQTFSSYFCPSDYSDQVYEEEVILRELPASVVPGSISATVTVTGDLIAPSLLHLGRLLRLPIVSGEQNLLQFAPNVYILRYLRATDHLCRDQLTIQLKEKAIANMIIGYQRQETFRRKDGSYVVFRNDLEGSSWLTAFAVRVNAYASEFMSVSVGDLQASVDWLRTLQDVDTGCFHPTGRIIHRALRGTVRDEVALTAYILAAMMEAGIHRHDHTIKKGMECLDLALNGMGDPYTAALMAYTFALAEQECLTKAINILNQLAIQDPGTIHWETGREDIPLEDLYLHHKAAAQDIEMTAYVLLSYSIYREDSYVIISGNKIARWLINQLNDIGGFSSTQDTMVALQALSEYARVSRIVRGKTNIKVNVHFGCEENPHSLKVTEQNRLKIQQLPVPLIPVDIRIDATGDACAMTQVKVRYNMIPEEPRNPKFILTYKTEPVDNDCDVQKIKICTTYGGKERASNLAVISIKLVSGYSADKASVEDLKTRGQKDGLRTVETDGKTIDIFVDKFTLKQKCFNVIAGREFDIRDTKKGIITVYDYYEPSRTVSTFFKFGCETEAENDENDPKPGLCPDVDIGEGGFGVCSEMCQDDSSCDGSHKCCSNGCGHMCMLPTGLEKPAAETKFGSCPLVEASKNRRICEDKCASDDDCNNIRKCCRGSAGCKECTMPSELNHCPVCLSQLPAVAAQVFCKYDYVVSGKLLDDGLIEIKRDMKTNKRIRGLPNVKRVVGKKCSCDVLGTRSLVMLMFNNRDLDLETQTVSFQGSSVILKLTTQLKSDVADLPEMCNKPTGAPTK